MVECFQAVDERKNIDILADFIDGLRKKVFYLVLGGILLEKEEIVV